MHVGEAARDGTINRGSVFRAHRAGRCRAPAEPVIDPEGHSLDPLFNICRYRSIVRGDKGYSLGAKIEILVLELNRPVVPNSPLEASPTATPI
jgi:hypothetical protein